MNRILEYKLRFSNILQNEFIQSYLISSMYSMLITKFGIFILGKESVFYLNLLIIYCNFLELYKG